MIKIDEESKQRTRYPFDVDNFCKRYVTSNGYYIFTSPLIETLEKYRYFLLKNSVVKNFNSKYKYKPSYLSMDEYGVPNLDYLLMFINNVACIEDFNLTEVIIPAMSSIVEICYDKVDHGEISDMEKISW